MFPFPEHRKVNYLINLLIVISLLLGSVTPGLAFSSEEQRERGKLARNGGSQSRTASITTQEQASGKAEDESSPAWLRLTAVASPEAVALGEVVMLAWQVENLGGQAETGAVLTADMPAGVVVQPKQVEPPLAYDPAAKRVAWALDEVVAGESHVASLPVRVTGQRVGEVVEIVAELRAADGTLISDAIDPGGAG